MGKPINTNLNHKWMSGVCASEFMHGTVVQLIQMHNYLIIYEVDREHGLLCFYWVSV